MVANKLVPGFSFSLDALPVDSNVSIPMTGVPAGKYAILVDAFSETGQVIASTHYDGLPAPGSPSIQVE